MYEKMVFLISSNIGSDIHCICVCTCTCICTYVVYAYTCVHVSSTKYTTYAQCMYYIQYMHHIHVHVCTIKYTCTSEFLIGMGQIGSTVVSVCTIGKIPWAN